MTHRGRLAAPRHYPVSRKETSYVHDMEGSRSPERAIPVSIVLRDMLEYADTESEAKEIVQNNGVLRNGQPLSSIKQGVAVLDVITLSGEDTGFRALRRGDRFELAETEDTRRVAKITGKRDTGEGYSYALHTGENHFSKDDFETDTTLVFSQESLDQSVELKEGTEVVAVDGGHAGKTGELQEIHSNGRTPNEAEVSTEDEDFTTHLENLVATGGVDL